MNPSAAAACRFAALIRVFSGRHALIGQFNDEGGAVRFHVAHADVAFAEDKSTIHRRNAGSNFATLRRAALSLLRQNPGKESIGLKRKAAALDTDFLEEILTGTNKGAKV